MSVIQDMIEEIKILLKDSATRYEDYNKIVNEIGEQYNIVYKKLAISLKERNLDNPNIFSNLNLWKAKFKDFGSYSERRIFVDSLYEDIISKITGSDTVGAVEDDLKFNEKIDAEIVKIQQLYNESKTGGDFHRIGVSCRELMVAVSKILAEQTDSVSYEISPSHFEKNFELFIEDKMSGRSNEAIRGLSKKTLAYIQAITHNDNSTKQDVKICCIATYSLLNIVQVLMKEEDPKCIL